MVQEHYGTENVTVMLDWIEEQHVSYNLIVTTPSVGGLVRHDIVENGSAQLTLSYNTVYSVKFVATLCGQNSANNFTLQYGEYTSYGVYTAYIYIPYAHIDTAVTCGHPPALVGTNITISISCPHGDDTSTGMNATFINTYTCMSDRQWEPDPNVGRCNSGKILIHSLSVSLVWVYL